MNSKESFKAAGLFAACRDFFPYIFIFLLIKFLTRLILMFINFLIRGL